MRARYILVGTTLAGVLAAGLLVFRQESAKSARSSLERDLETKPSATREGPEASTPDEPARPLEPMVSPARVIPSEPTPTQQPNELEPAPAEFFQPARETMDEERGDLKKYYDLWAGEREDERATARAKDRMLDVIENYGVGARHAEVSCRPSACRYAFGFTSLLEMAPLEKVPKERYEGRLVTGRGQRQGPNDWVVVVYQVFYEDDG